MQRAHTQRSERTAQVQIAAETEADVIFRSRPPLCAVESIRVCRSPSRHNSRQPAESKDGDDDPVTATTAMSLFLKFGVLLMRTVAKPVSNMVKSTVKDHDAFRKLAVGGARLHARTNARWDRIVQRKPVVDKKGNPIVRRELTEDEAISLAADVIGEAFLL
jgi:hypothetical protein